MTSIVRPLVPLARLVGEFSDVLLAVDLPRLPPERRSAAVEFTATRVAVLPSPMRAGIVVVAVAVAAAGRVVGLRRIAGVLAGRPLPILGDYVRFVRSLTFAYVWETWPSTAADGAAR